MASENKKVEVVPNLSSIPGSRKVYVQGSREDIQVPMREITLTPTAVGGTEQENPPFVCMIAAAPTRTARTARTSARACPGTG